MTIEELGQRVKAKHPEYASYPDLVVANRVMAKYPEYKSHVTNIVDTKSPFGMAKAMMGLVPEFAPSPADRVQSGFDKAGEAIAEFSGGQGYPKTGAVAGTATSMLPTILGFLGPKEPSNTILAPRVPLSRQGAVNAAMEAQIPLSRAEQTGSPTLSALESSLEKTPLGSAPINKFRAEQVAAKEAAIQHMGDKMGTSSDVYTAGQKAQSRIIPRREEMNIKRSEIFDTVPTEINIPLNQSISTADQIVEEQSKFLPTTRNSDVMAIAQDIQKAERGISSGEGVTGGLEARGVTTQIPGKTIKPSEITRSSSLMDEKGNPLTYQEAVPGKRIPPTAEYGTEYSVSPESPLEPKSNYQLLKRLRETLGGKIEEAKQSKNYSAMRDYTRLKAGVDSDIESFVSGQSKPLESMVAKEFKQTYKKANAFSGAYKNLFDSDQSRALLEAPPEKIVGMVFKKNNETGIKQFRALAGEEGFLPAKQRFTQDLLEGKNIKSELNKYEPGTLAAIYRPDELKKLQGFADAMDLMMGAEKKMGNPSGTARHIVGAGSWGAAGYALKAGHPGVALSIIGLPYLAAKGLAGMASGIKIPGVAQKLIRGSIGASQRFGRESQSGASR